MKMYKVVKCLANDYSGKSKLKSPGSFEPEDGSKFGFRNEVC